MTATFRSDASTINATAGTSIVVTKPAGTVADDVLIAVIAAASQTTITPPAGWELEGTQDVGANLRSWVYRKVAASEGANYTWTLGASARNYGWIGCYDGIDPDDPVFDIAAVTYTSGTAFAYADVDLYPEGLVVGAAVALRTAGGSATTWTAAGGTERDDSSTNAGSGLDITGAVWDDDTTDINTYTASQSQTQVVVWSIALRPYWVPYDGGHVDRMVRAAFGADPDGDPDLWSWTDISDYVYENPGITIVAGRRTAHGQADPTRISLTLNNSDGRFTPFLATGAYYPNIRRGLPLQVLIDSIGVTPPYEIVTAFVDSWEPGWDESGNVATVVVEALGRLSRINQDASRVLSPVRYATESLGPVGYWPCEDSAGSATIAEVTGGVPASQSSCTFAGDSSLAGAGELLVLSSSSTPGSLAGRVPAYAATTAWTWTWALRIPQAVLSATTLLEWSTGGTLVRWRLTLSPGSPDSLALEAYNSTGTQVLTSNTLAFDETYYGNGSDDRGSWLLWSVSATQDGADIDWSYEWRDGGGGTGKSGTVTTQTIGNATGWKVPASSNLLDAGFGQVAAYAEFDPNIGTIDIVMDGCDGEEAPQRFYRLLGEAGVERDIDFTAGAVWQKMGPQSRSNLGTLLTEINEVELGLLHDAGPSGAVILHTRDTRYNADVAMALDCLADEVSPGFAPKYDSQQMCNEFVASRLDGSSYTARDPAHVAIEGRYDQGKTVNVQTDPQLPDHAGWRVRLGTVDEMRVPQLAINFRAAPHLTEAWIRGGLNTRTTVDNLPDQYPGQFSDLFVEGYTMKLSTVDWNVVADCSPASPYTVFVVEDDTLGRLDAASCVLAEALDTTETGVDVTTDTLIATSGSTPFDLDIGGERVTVTAVAGSSNPQTLTVTRSVNGVVKSHSSGATVRLWSNHAPAL